MTEPEQHIPHSRLVYIAIGDGGVITTRSFHKDYENTKADHAWAVAKIDAIEGDDAGLLNHYENDPERCGTGLDQDFEWSSLIFFCINSKGNRFVAPRFSAELVDPPAGATLKSPFSVIDSPGDHFFGLHNLHQGPTPGRDYSYKFNLHLEAAAHPGDTPAQIPWTLDPVIKNQGPP